MSLSITFWGTRGTIPVPGERTMRYGGNTSCVAVRDSAGRCLVLDAGTGIRGLGAELRKAAPSRVDILLSHVHWDHIQGMPFFPLLYADGSEIRIHGPAPAGVSLESVLERQMDPAVFPVPRAARSARVTVEEVAAGAGVDVPGFLVESCGLSHPGGALGFKITPADGGPALAYVTDNELGPGGADRVPRGWRRELESFLSGASLLIHDAMYTRTEAAKRSGWGHSSTAEAVALAGAAGVRQLILFHHDPDHEDEQVDGLLAEARAEAAKGLAVDAAREGWTLAL
jgi:phosphoribosyl 1,2-cyclic phosphodiesterase